MQVPAALVGKADQGDVVGLGFRGQHLGQDGALRRMALLLQRHQREGDVARRERRSVVETRPAPQQEAVGELVGRDADAARQEAIERFRLVGTPTHQGVEGGVHAGRAIALEGVDVERVEGVEILVPGLGPQLHHQGPPFGASGFT